MKQHSIQFLLLAIAFLFIGVQANGQQTLFYNFQNNFNEKYNNGPALIPLGAGSFVTDTMSELSCLPHRVYFFDNNNGLQFNNTAAGTFLGESYSIELYFKWLDDASFFKRIIDFKNRTQDYGLYGTPTLLGFFDGLDVPTNALTSNQYVYICITRDSASQEVGMYIDGVLGGTFVDSLERGVIDTSQVLNFFRDDLAFGNEARPGNIAMLKLSNYVLNTTEVAASYTTMKDSLQILSFNSNFTAACFTGHQLVLDNTSQNDPVVTYSWDMGDGTGLSGLSVNHTYASSGMYTVALVGTDGLGCFDTATRQINIYDTVPVDLGTDVVSCDGSTVSLDAGGPYAAYIWNNTATTQSVAVTASGSYDVVVTDNAGCTGTDTVNVQFNALPPFSLLPGTDICDGDSVTLVMPAGFTSYEWNTGATTASITVATAGTYTGTVTDSVGCFTTATTLLTVHSLPVVNLGADTAACDGITITLDAGSGFAAYLWNDNSVNPTLDVTGSGFYAVMVTDSMGCMNTDTVEVTILPNPVVTLGNDTAFCGGTTMMLDAGPGFFSYLWSDGTQNQTINVSTAGTYFVTVGDVNGCSGTDTISLLLTPLLDLGPDLLICDGVPVTLDGGSNMADYAWNTGSTTQTILVANSGTYSVQITDSSGCVNADSVAIVFGTPPVVDLGPSTIAICENTSIVLDAGPGAFSYSWNTGNTNQLQVADTAGWYTVTVASADGCTASDSILISVNLAPIVTLPADTFLCLGTSLLLDAGPGYTNYQWNMGSITQTFLVLNPGVYSVTVTDVNGCTGEDSITVGYYPVVPVPTITQINSNTLQSSAASTYQWYQNPGGLIAGAVNQTYMPPVNGTYYVVITDSNGCVSGASLDFNFINTGMLNVGSHSVQVYPNPVADVLFIRSANVISGTSVSLYDATGKLVMHKEPEVITDYRLDVSGLSPGIYHLVMEGNGSKATLRIAIGGR